MRRYAVPTIAIALAVCALAAAWLVAIPDATAAPRLQATESPCVVTHTKTAGPSVVRLGETVDVTSTVRVGCPDDARPLHLVLVIDGSASMEGTAPGGRGGRGDDVKAAAKTFVQTLDLASNPDTKVGVVEFDAQARRHCALLNSEARVLNCIDRIGANGGTRIDLGIMEGVRVLSQERRSVPLPNGQRREVMVVVTDGANNAGCAPVLSAARQARGQGILIFSICVGPDCDAACMRSVASSPRWFFEGDGLAELNTVFDEIARIVTTSEWVKVEVFDQLPLSMSYVADSAQPPSYSDRGSYLIWGDLLVPTDGLTYTMKVLPTKLGHLPTSSLATGRLQDWEARTRTWIFDVPYVLVIDPSVPPTITVTAPPAPSPTHTPAATLTPVVRPTSTPGWPSGVTPGVCDVALARAPAAAVSSAMANPNTVGGFGERCNPSQPPSPFNRVKDQLSIEQPSKPYHPLYNALTWKCGCP